MNELDIRNLCLVDFSYNFNKTRQTALDLILQLEDGIGYLTLAKNMSKLAKVNNHYLNLR